VIELFHKYYRLLIRAGSRLQSPFLLAVRLYWAWQSMETGGGKLTDIGKVIGFFTDLSIPAMLNAYFVSALEFACGLFLITGIGSRSIAPPLVIDVIVAYVTADREALLSISPGPDKFKLLLRTRSDRFSDRALFWPR
jgi:putative oxidoreductase